MKVLMLSKACLIGAYQRKLEEIAAIPDVTLTVAVPPTWRDSQGSLSLERTYTQGYTLVIEPIRFNGHFHLHYYPGFGRLLARVQPDIVHIDEEPYNFATWHALRLARKAGAKTLFFSWQNLHRNYPPPFSWFESRVLRQADAAIFGNQDAGRVWRDKGYHGRGTVIPQFGVDPQIFSLRSQRTNSTGYLKIAYVGRLVAEKGVDLLLHAIAQLSNGYSDNHHDSYRLEILGSGPLRDELTRLADELKVAKQVRFVDWMPSTEIPAYLATVDVLALPSRTCPNWKEQFGRVLVEAMAVGVPVIGANSGEIPNVIGDAGLLVAEDDVPALCDALARLHNDPALYARCVQRGRARVLAHYTQAQVAAHTVAFYRQMLGK